MKNAAIKPIVFVAGNTYLQDAKLYKVKEKRLCRLKFICH